MLQCQRCVVFLAVKYVIAQLVSSSYFSFSNLGSQVIFERILKIPCNNTSFSYFYKIHNTMVGYCTHSIPSVPFFSICTLMSSLHVYYVKLMHMFRKKCISEFKFTTNCTHDFISIRNKTLCSEIIGK